ncbi:hypothetical protein ACFYT3_11860 [Nocardia amikacinitolerans]|uniref:hypothetical protein n=1 Tax=Nocardia amikacinitolerans TaxID=756689 RepID=UPI0020A5A2F5|nr:hypothetical protein [Nocardia amikacinitolerans]MCP2291108.1 hypothetical protein [Nocardia amikacinitolerans]
MFERLGRAVATVALGTTVLLTFTTGSATAAFSLPPANPHLGPLGTATMHGDAESSDATPFAGPGAGDVDSDFRELAAACPTILQGADGMPQALCTKILDRAPKVFLLDPRNGHPLASLDLTKGSLLGGVYAYLDNQDRMVTVDGSGELLRIGHRRTGDDWQVFVESRTDISQAVTGHCGGGDCDAVSSVMADFDGRVWFATDNAAAGFFDPATGATRSIVLGHGEKVANSISTAPEGVAIATTHALYLVTVDGSGNPQVNWRYAYDRGPARKPGQLSWGTGATPTFFGPGAGTEYLAITDNAVPKENLLVFDTTTGNRVCSVPTVDGTENSPIGSGSSLFVASTYGYPYPAVPEGAGPSEPANAAFTGGMVRVDVTGSGCQVKWTNDALSAAVPRLSVADGKIYTVTRHTIIPTGSVGVTDNFRYTVIDAATGRIEKEKLIGATAVHNTLQMVGTISPDRTLYQGTMSGLFRIAPR